MRDTGHALITGTSFLQASSSFNCFLLREDAAVEYVKQPSQWCLCREHCFPVVAGNTTSRHALVFFSHTTVSSPSPGGSLVQPALSPLHSLLPKILTENKIYVLLFSGCLNFGFYTTVQACPTKLFFHKPMLPFSPLLVEFFVWSKNSLQKFSWRTAQTSNAQFRTTSSMAPYLNVRCSPGP